MYKYLRKLWKKTDGIAVIQKARAVQLRASSTVTRLEKPTRLDKARAVGYKAKQGIVVVSVKVTRGSRKTPKVAGGRGPRRSGRFFTPGKSIQHQAEDKAARKYPNMEVVNSYWVNEDGKYKWYEVILADRAMKGLKKDKELRKVVKEKGRAQRGLTAAGKRNRGLAHRGKRINS